jgi:hypothetical protein
MEISGAWFVLARNTEMRLSGKGYAGRAFTEEAVFWFCLN